MHGANRNVQGGCGGDGHRAGTDLRAVLVSDHVYLRFTGRSPEGNGSPRWPEADRTKEDQAMILNPTTREQARSNAITAAEMAADAEDSTGGAAYAQLAQAWAAIAEVFPHEDDMVAAEPPEGMTFVHESWVEEAKDAIAFKNRLRTNPGYSLMAVTPSEMRTVMALRTGRPEDPQTPAKGTATVRPVSGSIPVDSTFYAVLMAVVVATVEDAENGLLVVHPEDVSRTEGKTVSMSQSDIPGEGPQWGLRVMES